MALVPALDLRSVSNDTAIARIPQNLEAEQALLGALLYDNAAFERLGDNLQPRHFHEPFHQRMFEAVQQNRHTAPLLGVGLHLIQQLADLGQLGSRCPF